MVEVHNKRFLEKQHGASWKKDRVLQQNLPCWPIGYLPSCLWFCMAHRVLFPYSQFVKKKLTAFFLQFFFFQECSPIILSPGYILSRSKEKINVTIKTDQLFTEGPQVYVIQIKFVFIISRSLTCTYIYISVKIPIIHHKNVVSRFIYFNSSFYLLMVF